MNTAVRVCSLLFATVVCVATAKTQVAGAVVISRTGGQIEISIDRLVPLSDVLNNLCQELKAQCEGTPKAMGMMVPAQQISGDWRRVLTTLLVGTGLNYTTHDPDASSAGMLSINGLAPKALRSSRMPRSREDRERLREANDQALLPPSADTMASTMRNAGTTSSVDSSTAEDAAPGDPTPRRGQRRLASPAPEVIYASPGNDVGQAYAAGTAEFMLFPDSFGNPTPISQQNPKYLLFPDSRGNLIPISGQASSPYLPFPDANGRPIPVVNKSLPYLLFPDSAGRLIPVPSGSH